MKALKGSLETIRKQVEKGRGSIPTVGYDCERCEDTGWHSFVEDGHNYGEPCPECSGRRFVESMLRGSGILEEYWGDTFDTFIKRAGTQQAMQAVRELAETDNPLRLVIMLGETGCGKTRLAIAFILEAINQGKISLLKRTINMLDEIKNTFDHKQGPTTDEVRGLYQLTPYLVLDEFTWSAKSDFQIQMLDDIVCWRYENGKPTMLTTNHNLGELEADFFRIVRRAREPGKGIIVENEATPYLGGEGDKNEASDFRRKT